MSEEKGKPVFACLVPHPPIMVPEVGGEETDQVENTVRALRDIGRRLVVVDPEVAIFITPHGPLSQDIIMLAGMAQLKGDLRAFGASKVSFDYRNDMEMVEALRAASGPAGFPVEVTQRWGGMGSRRTPELDHGVTAPLYYLREALENKGLVIITYTLHPLEEVYAFGTVIRRVIERSGRRVAVIASGDLSHRLKPGAPAGYRPEGAVFDQRLQDLVATMDVPGIMDLPEDLVEHAGECGLRSLVMALGVLDGLAVDSEILSYEGPFGIGYLVAAFLPGEEDRERLLLDKLRLRAEERRRTAPSGQSLPVHLAREALETFVRHGRRLQPPAQLPDELKRAAGAFVSLKIDGRLRGCIGTIKAVRPNLAEEIIANAISSGTRDPRFDPVRPEELSRLAYSVDILGEPEVIQSKEELDPRRFGVIVIKDRRVGLLLPDLEGVDSAEEQVSIAKQKAGIGPDEDCQIQRFEVLRYH